MGNMGHEHIKHLKEWWGARIRERGRRYSRGLKISDKSSENAIQELKGKM